MKFLVLFNLLWAIALCSFSQKGQQPAIKVYVKDAETGKNVADARVTLEGYEIPPIEGQYNKKGKYYYFKTIPIGYNTVMSYHEKYNEKGFQDVNGLPSELTLKVQDYRFVSYSFDEPVLRSFGKDYLTKTPYLKEIERTLLEKGFIKRKSFRYLYTEDPYHIAIISKENNKDFFSNNKLIALLNELSLEQTTHQYSSPELYTSYCYGLMNYALYKGRYYRLGNVDSICEIHAPFDIIYKVYFFNKKDKTKFKRYNCKEIEALRKLDLNVASLSNRVIEYYAKSSFNPTSFDVLYNHRLRKIIFQDDIANYEFGKLKIPEKVFFKNSKEESLMYFGKKGYRSFYDTDGDDTITSLFFLIPKNISSNIGLGALDVDSNDSKNFYNHFYFSNDIGKNELPSIK